MRRSGVIFALGLALACANAEERSGRVAVELDSPVTRGERLTESIGIETEKGHFTAILEAGCPLPCEDTVSFGTMEPDQEDILLFLYRGTGEEITTAHALGTYEITGYPATDADDVEVAVTFRADAEGIFLITKEAVTLRRSKVEGS